MPPELNAYKSVKRADAEKSKKISRPAIWETYLSLCAQSGNFDPGRVARQLFDNDFHITTRDVSPLETWLKALQYYKSIKR